MTWYRGWTCWWSINGPPCWKAQRFGVNMNARTLDDLKQMIDSKLSDERHRLEQL